MNRLFLVVSCLAALAGCVDSNATSATDQDLLTTADPPPGSGPYSTIFPVHWDPRVNFYTSAFWDPGTPSGTPNWSHHMTYLVNDGEPAVKCPIATTTCSSAAPATKMVWLISNERVYRTWEIDVGDMGTFNSMRDDAAANVKTAAGGSSITYGVVTGTDSSPPLGGVHHGGPPHAWPIATVTKTFNAVNSFRGLDLGNIQAGQMQ